MAVRRLEPDDCDAVAGVLRQSFDWALPHIAGLYTPAEDRAFVKGQLFAANELWGAFDGGALVGYVAYHAGWIDHLYVTPSSVGHGIGTGLLDIAKSREARLDLWTFQANVRARRFYEARGFVEIKRTDGATNEEREPDMCYRWVNS